MGYMTGKTCSSLEIISFLTEFVYKSKRHRRPGTGYPKHSGHVSPKAAKLQGPSDEYKLERMQGEWTT